MGTETHILEKKGISENSGYAGISSHLFPYSLKIALRTKRHINASILKLSDA